MSGLSEPQNPPMHSEGAVEEGAVEDGAAQDGWVHVETCTSFLRQWGAMEES